MAAQWFDHSPAVLESADCASRRALELAPDLAEAHSARGFALTLKGDFTGAVEKFEQALQIEPANYDALYLIPTFYPRICLTALDSSLRVETHVLLIEFTSPSQCSACKLTRTL